jgi:hypothetical protein
VAVRAACNALRDFLYQHTDRRCAVHERANRRPLLAVYVIELHDERVKDTAVDTRMGAQVFLDESTVPNTMRLQSTALSVVVRGVIRPVVFATVASPTPSANRMYTPGPRVAHGKFALILFQTASPTALHTRSVTNAYANMVALSEPSRTMAMCVLK